MNRILFIIKPVVPVLLGFVIGIFLSFAIAPLLANKGSYGSCSSSQTKLNSGLKSNELLKSFDYGNSEDFEPRIKGVVIDKNTQVDSKKADFKKPVRPRYAATELGMKEKLFVGIVSSLETIDTLGVAVNRTIAAHVPKLVFFMNNRGNELPSGLAVVIFTHEEQYRVPFQMFNYIKDHYISTYDWYYFASDSTYTRGENLLNIVNHMSIIHNVYMCSTNGENYCSLDGGILLSQVKNM